MRDRVLTKHGFQPFPQKLENDAIRQGNKNPPADTGVKEPLINSNAAAKQEMLLKMNEDAKAQAEQDRIIKERELKRALEEKAFEEELAAEQAGIEAAKLEKDKEAEKLKAQDVDPVKAAAEAAKLKADEKKLS